MEKEIINLVKKNLNDLGYHYGTVDEFFHDMDVFYEMASKTKNEVYNEVLENNKDIWYMSCIHGAIGNQFPIDLSIDQISERKNLIQRNNYTVDQQWFYFRHYYLNVWQQVITDFILSLYTDLTEENILHECRFTLYQDGDFTDIHIDGLNPGRKCAILIYLSDPADYDNGGGRLILSKDSTNNLVEHVLPITPNYVIIDIEKHSLYHAVEKVQNNFKRFAFLDFISNSDIKHCRNKG